MVDLNFEKLDGLIPAVVQDARSNKVLMVAFMDKTALEKTIETKLATFYSRTRRSIWVKGESSGNYLRVKELIPDCDHDTLLVRVLPDGPTCHTGSRTCFHESGSSVDILFELEEVIAQRRDNPKPASYTSDLFGKGLDRVAQKLGEEAVELIIAAKNSDDTAFRSEAADLLFHFMTLLALRKVPIDNVFAELAARRTEDK